MTITMNSFLSVLAAAISGNAHLHEKLGSSEAARAVDRCLEQVRHAIEAGGGSIVQAGGGEVMAVFGTTDETIDAAIEIQRRVADLPPVSGVKMTVRVGVSYGVTARAVSAEDGLAKEAAHLAGIAKAGQILSVGRICPMLPETVQALAVPGAASTLSGEAEHGDAVVEIRPKSAPAESPQPEPAAAPAAGVCLRLSYGEAVIVLDGEKPVIDMGRGSTCDVVVRDPRASRHHATIDFRGDRVVLVDKSTNGTYVTIDGDSERFVKHREFTLHGKGSIAFASSSVEPDADCARFECIRSAPAGGAITWPRPSSSTRS
jgi:hypothetical protein